MVFDKICAILAEQLELSAESITESSLIVEELGASSLDLVDIVMTIETDFDIEVIDSDVEKIKTVADLVDYLEERA